MSFRTWSSVQHVLLPLYYMRTFVNSLSWAPNRGIPIKSIQYHLSYQENPVSGFLSPHDARFDFSRVDRSLSDISCIQHMYILRTSQSKCEFKEAHSIWLRQMQLLALIPVTTRIVYTDPHALGLQCHYTISATNNTLGQSEVSFLPFNYKY